MNQTENKVGFILVGGLYPKEIEKDLAINCKNSYLQTAPNEFQHAIIQGFVSNGIRLHVITAPFLGSYPIKFSKMIVPHYAKESEKITIDSVEYINVLPIKYLSIVKALKKSLSHWLHKHSISGTVWVIVYNTIPYYLQAVLSLKKIFPNIKVCVIVTDLLDNAISFKENKSFLRKIILDIQLKQIKKIYGAIDKYVLLTSQMIEKIPKASSKSMILEGIWNPSKCSENVDNSNLINEGLNYILYAGTLQQFGCVMNLVKAFLSIDDDNIRLIICGSGACESEIKEISNNDSRIILIGRVSHDLVMYLEKHVQLLINPRLPNGDITRFSFPSKTIEYLVSGTPMLGYHLEGIPAEYYNYFYTPENYSIEALAKKIKEIFGLSEEERNKFGREAESFIMNQKNPEVQIKRVINFLCANEFII